MVISGSWCGSRKLILPLNFFRTRKKTWTSYSKFSEIQTYYFTFKALKKEIRGAIKSLSLES